MNNRLAHLKPTVVCLCGSTKFKDEFLLAQKRETLTGKIVLSVGWFSHADADVFYPNEQEKQMLDDLHKRKIDLADEILIIDVNGYIGESTRSEIEYATKLQLPVRYLTKEATVSDQPNEPVFVLYASDWQAVPTLNFYIDRCENIERALALTKRMSDFGKFALAHPELMKESDADQS